MIREIPQTGKWPVYVNIHGQLCRTLVHEGFWSKLLYDHTDINIVPDIQGFDVNGNLINADDFTYNPQIY